MKTLNLEEYKERELNVARENRANVNNEKLNEYFNKIFQEAKVEAQNGKKNASADEVIKSMIRRANERNVRQPIFDTLDEAKKAFYSAMLINCDNKFLKNDNMLGLMQEFSFYFANFESRLDLKKGIGISGNSGIGKTFLFESAKLMCKVTQQNNFTMYTAKDINREVLADAKNYDKFLKNDILIDDLGIEEATINSYGTKTSPVSDIIFDRERLWQNEGLRTHITTNLTFDEVQQRYGDRTWNRLRRMISWTDFN